MYQITVDSDKILLSPLSHIEVSNEAISDVRMERERER
jgi:hypothetical protein